MNYYCYFFKLYLDIEVIFRIRFYWDWMGLFLEFLIFSVKFKINDDWIIRIYYYKFILEISIISDI